MCFNIGFYEYKSIKLKDHIGYEKYLDTLVQFLAQTEFLFQLCWLK